MKTTFRIAIILAIWLSMGVSGVAMAEPNAPVFFSNLTVNNNPVYSGETPIFTVQGVVDFADSDSGSNESCLAIALPNNTTAWGGVITYSATANGSTITMGAWDTDVPTDCGGIATAPTNTQWWYSTFPKTSGGSTFQSVVVQIQATVHGTAGNYTIRAAMDNSAIANDDVWLYIDMTGNPIVQNGVATTRYVANTVAQCQGYTPCDTGPNGLLTALSNDDATTIIVVGAYNANPNSIPILTGGDTLKGQGMASVNFVGSTDCDETYFLAVTNAEPGGGTIQDLTFDGTCGTGSLDYGIVIDTSSGTATMSNVTIMDFVFEGVHVTSGDLQSTDVIYYRNGIGARVSGSSATATFDQCNFAQNTETGVQIDIGTATITNSSFSGNVSYGVRHTGGTVSIGTVPGNGNTFTVPSGATGISSIGTGATIRDNTISGGLRGIYLGAAASSIYANTVSGASSYQIECATTSVAGAGFNYIGGNYGGGGSNCSDATDQLGSPIVSWTGNNNLGGCTVSSAGPIFDLGNVSPYGLTPPQGRNSKYYAVTSAAGNVTVTGGSTQFKMYMDGTDTGAGGTDVCNPMTYACWEANGGSTPRVQSGAGYYFSGTLDPTAISLRSLTASSARNTWLPAILLGAALLLGGGGLLLVRRRR